MVTIGKGLKMYEKDKNGFAVPASPGHSLHLLNSYMRTRLLLMVHYQIHQERSSADPGSPLRQLARSLEQISSLFQGDISADPDIAHDLRLIRHHLTCHRATLEELGPDYW